MSLITAWLFMLNKKIVLGITGSIAAYKSPDLIRRLREIGVQIRVVMTSAAKEFITPLTLQAVSGNPVHDDLLNPESEAAMGHIELARWADLVVIAPASADFMARLAHGEGNDLLSTLCLATQAPIALAPAMNQQMWENTATQTNQQILLDRGVQIWGPDTGSQACGEFGAGRMLEPQALLEYIQHFFNQGILEGRKVLITAGPTQEAIDPVRYLSNRSSGKMGYALAQAAAEAGASVTLISGPTHLICPHKVHRIDVTSAQEMYDAVLSQIKNCEIFIAAAAVADYCIMNPSIQKIKKTTAAQTLELSPTPDILKTVAALPHPPFTIGFAAETENIVENAKKKLASKNLDVVIANQVGPQQGFECDENAVTLIYRSGKITEIPLMNKLTLARKLLEILFKNPS